MEKRMRKRRANLLYRLRKKGVRCITKRRIIEYPYGGNPLGVIQIRRLTSEYDFYVQFVITD
nr:MAG TPA: hypothetical protein [Caudoviricetes sp.]